MTKPLIGISPSGGNEGDARIRTAYLEAIRDVGGIGVLLPNRDTDFSAIAAYACHFDGFLLAGGGDLHPSYYQENPISAELAVDEVRDRFEFLLCDVIFPTGKPILGICRGMQVLNVYLGGTLYQDIPHHRNVRHDLIIRPTSHLASVVRADGWTVNSFHHQAIHTVAPTLLVDAHSADGTVEAVRHVTHPYLSGVQFHPELMASEDPMARRLFRSFVGACQVNRPLPKATGK
jgi:putative glutamine amidotransferase